MSFLNKVFGKNAKKPKSQPQTTLSDTIREFKDTQQALIKKQNYLEEKIKKEISNAKSLGSTNRKAALQALGRKKRYEKQLRQIDNTLTTLECQVDILENANINNLALTSMKQASDALKTAQNYTDVDKVEGLLNDLADHRETVDEITQVLSNSDALDKDFDEEELEKELELLEIDDDLKLPKVPTENVKTHDSSGKTRNMEKKGMDKGKEAMASA